MENSNFSQLGINNLHDLAKFVVLENFIHHSQYFSPQQLKEEVDSVYKEELKFNNSKIFISRDSKNNINGSIRVLKWNSKDVLPIEKLFEIRPSLLTNNVDTEIWHIGRFAIKQFSDKAGFGVFKTLMTFAINEVCKNENSIALAECDVKLLRILRLLGIEAKALADPIYYLGSETIPVLLSYKGLKSFLDKNYYLLPQNFMSLHHSVVFKEIA
ncbi:hypothetical protein [Chryseobacterium indoltheticum]|uniref:hypothetical protein n=1 Tax=Chryseobacterium indoltheticum TaxID=254 RepID=UPI0019125B25|nr:hypothetical protein [Chryseobacterium indoltheticum]QQQ28325.1 hypothetical protein JJL46_20010 [Chryseobacterium indoltheticum]